MGSIVPGASYNQMVVVFTCLTDQGRESVWRSVIVTYLQSTQTLSTSKGTPVVLLIYSNWLSGSNDLLD